MAKEFVRYVYFHYTCNYRRLNHVNSLRNKRKLSLTCVCVGCWEGGSTGLHQNQAPSHKTFLCLHVNLQNMIKFFHTKPSDIKLILLLQLLLPHQYSTFYCINTIDWHNFKKVWSLLTLIKIKTHKTTASPYIYSFLYIWQKIQYLNVLTIQRTAWSEMYKNVFS